MIEEKLIVLKDGIKFEHEKIADKIEKKNISPSLITALESCHAKWAAQDFVMRKLVEEKDAPNTRGKVFHKIMEDFFSLPNDMRKKTELQRIKKLVINSKEFDYFEDKEKLENWVDLGLKNYYEMGAQPQKVEIANIKNGDSISMGLEVKVEGRIGRTSRKIKGFIDRLIVNNNSEKESFLIEDWKTGTKIKKWDHNTKNNTGIGEARQQTLYAMLLRDQGYGISGARLLYPYAKEIVPVDINNEEFNKNIVSSVDSTDDALEYFLETRTFKYSPSVLCSWCPLVNICPKALKINKEKMINARKEQPEKDVLLDGFEIGEK